MTATERRIIWLLEGVNLSRLGKRETAIYGTTHTRDILPALEKKASAAGFLFAHFQSDDESAFIQKIHAAHDEGVDALIVNAAAWTHTSLAIRDALSAAAVPFVEVHLSNTKSREPFRHHSYLSAIARGVIEGFGLRGYALALESILGEACESSKPSHNSQ